MNDFNLKIPAGAKIALVGHSGCGKSTLTNILLGFYNMREGEVTIDGKNLNRYDVLALRDQCGYVMQEPVLFNTTIKENILFGKPDATDEEVYIAAQKANALKFIMQQDNEELSKEELAAKLDAELKEAVYDSKIANYPNIAALYPQFTDKAESLKQLVIDVLTSMNTEMLS